MSALEANASNVVARPDTLDAAVDLAEAGGWTPAAGFTDLFPAEVAATLWDARPSRRFLDLSAIPELKTIARENDELRLGAGVTWTALARADLPPGLKALQQAAREVGGIQIQNRGTLGGNLCNASPAADGIPALAILDAQVELRSAGGARRLALADFVLGNRKTALRPGELLSAVLIPNDRLAAESCFSKLGLRKYLVISIVSVAAAVEIEPGVIREARIAVGACSPAPLRLTVLEERLAGLPADADFDAVLAIPYVFSELSPIDDVRANADYRRRAAREITSRMLRDLVSREV